MPGTETHQKKHRFNTIGVRLTFWFFIIAMLPLIMINVAIYFHMVHAMKVSIFSQLESVRDFKVAELNHWLEERILDIRTIAESNDIRELEKVNNGPERSNIAIISAARTFLTRYVQNYPDFNEIFVVSPYSDKIIVSTRDNREGIIPLTESHYENILQGSSLFIEDIHYSATLNKPCLAFSLPIFSRMGSGRVIGILVSRMNLETSLYELLNNAGMGKSGEILIVNKGAVVLNELRWYKDAPLGLKIKMKAAEDAFTGKTGIVETADYRGKKVLAAYTHIPLARWGFVAKQDLNEIYAPINRLREWMIVIFVATVLVVITVAFRVSESISRPINLLHKGSEIIGSGNLNYKVATDAKDEIGELSRTFDLMIEKLKAITASRNELNNEIAERKHLEKTLIDIKEHERRRIGHDLHDNLGQQLTAVSFKAQGLENTLRKKKIPEAEDAERLTELIEMAKSQVKSLSRRLFPILEKDEYSLMTAMVDLASNSETLFGILCVVKCDRPVPIYNEEALIHLYRIAQEAITNAARHARAGQIDILLERKNDDVTLAIGDDGIGFDVQNPKKGMGLEIMKYRANIIGSFLDIRSELNRGTVITCTFPDKYEKNGQMH